MSTGFSTAAGWLQNISGADNNANPNDNDKKEKDPIIRDLQSMKDQETRNGVHDAPKAPRHENRARAHESNGPRIQPKPKFVAHKEPTRGKKGKDKASR